MTARIGVKQPAAFQIEVKSSEEWKNLMKKPGLAVVDVYAAWCGPCKAIVNILKRIKIDCSDDLLIFATAQSDEIEALIEYRGKSQPTFLFYENGYLVDIVRGCDCPLLTKTILSRLKQVHDNLKNSSTECSIKISILEDGQKDELDPDEERLAKSMSRRLLKVEEIPVAVAKRILIVIIKPDAIRAGALKSIIKEILDTGFEILKQEEMLLTREMAADFYKKKEMNDYYDNLVEFMSSGPCVILVISKPGNEVDQNYLSEFLNLIGPTEISLAKMSAPNSLRARYGTDMVQDAVHCSDSHESASRELEFFFPGTDFSQAFFPQTSVQQAPLLQVPLLQVPLSQDPILQASIPNASAGVNRTLAIIRPKAYKKHKISILNHIKDSGFTIAMQKEIEFKRDQAEQFYFNHKDKEYFQNLIDTMTSGPSLALCLTHEDAVQTWRKIIGPNVVNENYRTTSKINENPEDNFSLSFNEKFADSDDIINPIHGSDSDSCASKEISILFPIENIVAVIKPNLANEVKDAIIKTFKEAGFTICAQKEVNLTKEMSADIYKEHIEKTYFDELTEYMSSGTTHFIILSKEDAVSEFRRLMGPTEPNEAKEKFPDSLRAKFGKDAIRNAVHCSSSASGARNDIARFFPDFNIEISDSNEVKEGLLKNDNLTNGEVEKSECNGKNENGESNQINVNSASNESPGNGDVFEQANATECVIETELTVKSNLDIANENSVPNNESIDKEAEVTNEENAGPENKIKSELANQTSNVSNSERTAECLISEIVTESITDSKDHNVNESCIKNEANNTENVIGSNLSDPSVVSEIVSVHIANGSIYNASKDEKNELNKILSEDDAHKELDEKASKNPESEHFVESGTKVETYEDAPVTDD
ncbi:thioredoxin domain-containing protein 6 isoform X7 [Hydra vulgaris]|uniref:Thioredoxin domain-containing protein 6 isoform X7 n=1 Tax=Hydra vulgaris TaxID=6087 RepID=A0ABM4C158_HYDVU